jgi:hypothetical protein
MCGSPITLNHRVVASISTQPTTRIENMKFGKSSMSTTSTILVGGDIGGCRLGGLVWRDG